MRVNSRRLIAGLICVILLSCSILASSDAGNPAWTLFDLPIQEIPLVAARIAVSITAEELLPEPAVLSISLRAPPLR
jgi:hypothetical protein